MPASANGSKRARGTGSVRSRRRGVWQVRWETGHGADRVYHAETVKGTKTEAEALLRERLAEKERARAAGTLTTDPKLTVGEWLLRWLDDVAVHNVRPRTLSA